MSVVKLTKRSEKELESLPIHVQKKFFLWARHVENSGLTNAQVNPGYHDEPLSGKLLGLIRSVRLTKGYRLYYRVLKSELEYVIVEGVNNHDYKKIERLFSR